MGTETTPSASVQAGILLPDRYRLTGRIASGGMATVWAGHDTLLDRRVAIKVVSEQLAADPRSIRRFKREARVAAHLSGHPHVVTIFDVGEATGPQDEERRPFIVMEHLAGGTVADALHRRRLPREQAMKWLRQAADALDFAHGRGVVHRDVKPPNFILDEAQTLHVADFGIARIAHEETITSSAQLFGTAAYISPEQALGRPATEASDRYSLAVVAYELLVGERPFRADHFAAQARQHVEDRPPRASRRDPRLPSEVDRVLARGLAKKPEERWDSAGSFVAALEDALAAPTQKLQPMPTEATVAQLPASAAIASGHRSRVAALATLAAVALLVLVLVALGQSGGANSTGKSASKPAANGAKRPQAAASTPRSTGTARTTLNTTAQPATLSSAGATALEARGHGLMMAGQYQQAVGVLRQAVASAPPSSLTYAYALYDLGRSLRLAGDPAAAVPILRQRLQIPNQTAVVQQELNLALAASGQSSPASGGGAAPVSGPGPAGAHGQGNGPAGHGDHGPGHGGD